MEIEGALIKFKSDGIVFTKLFTKRKSYGKAAMQLKYGVKSTLWQTWINVELKKW